MQSNHSSHMQSLHRQDSGASYHTSSIARNDNGMSFAAQARAHELHAFRSNKDRHQHIQEPHLIGVDGHEDSAIEMITRRQRWQRLEPIDAPDSNPPTESEGESESSFMVTGHDQAATLQCTSPGPLTRRRSESKVARLVTATQKRRARSGEFDDLDHSFTDADVNRRPSPFPSDQNHQSLQSLRQEYGAHVQAPVVNLPTAAAAPKPPAYYPAVKGTSRDQQRQTQSAELKAINQSAPISIPALRLRQPSNTMSNQSQEVWAMMSSDGFTPDSLGQSRRVSGQVLTDPFDTQSVASQEEESKQTVRPRPQPIMPPKKQSHSSHEFLDDHLPSFVRPTLKEIEAQKKDRQDKSPGAEPMVMGPDLNSRFDQGTRDAVAQALRSSARNYSVSMARPSRMSTTGGRRPPFGGYIFSNSPDGSFEKTEQEESDEIFHHLLLPVMATLKSYQIGEKGYFNQFVEAPEWTVDHSPAGQQSYFGENWGTPPARVGRDPRYRPFHNEMRGRDDIGGPGGGIQMQTPVRAGANRGYRAFQDYSTSSGSSPYSVPRGFRGDEEHGYRNWNTGAGEHARRIR